MTMKVTQRSQNPGSGSRSLFNPTNLELVNILHRRIEREKRSTIITDIQNLYEKEPWLLQHVRHVRFHENEWFYFVTRQKRPGIKKADSKTPSRKVGESGRWKTTGTLTRIKNEDGFKIGSMKSLSFKVKSETEKDGITTGWVMHEFILDKPGFQKVVLCRIRFYPRKDNAQFAPRLTPIMIGLEREDGSTLVKNNFQNHMISTHYGVAAAAEELHYSDAPVETHQAQGRERWTGSCSGEVVSYSASQHQQNMGQDSNYPISDGGMEQHQNFGSYGQQKNHILGHMEQYGQGFGDMVEYQNQYLGQEKTDARQVPMMMNQALSEEQQWNEYSGPSSAHQYLGHDMVPMTQCLMAHYQEQHFAAQHQHFSVNGSMEQHQSLGSWGQFLGESFGQQQNHSHERQATYLSLREQQCQNQFWGKKTNPSHPAQAMEMQQPWNGYAGLFSAQPYYQAMEMQQPSNGYAGLFSAQPYYQAMEMQQPSNGYSGQIAAQPYYQGMMEHQNFGSSALCLAQSNQYLRQNNDLLALGELTALQKHLRQDSNLSLIQQQNQILGQATHLSPMEQQFYQNQVCGQHTDPLQVPIMMNQALGEQHNAPCWAQPYDQHKGQNNELPTFPMNAQQQQDNFVRNSAAQLQLEEQDNVPLINQTMEEQATDLPMNQGVDELHGDIVGFPTFNELIQQFLEDEDYQEIDSEMANFGNEEWAQQLGENTPEEEAELTAALANCKTLESLFNFFSN